MTRDLSRLLRPSSIALFGGRWTANVIAQLQKSGFDGDIWPVNPQRKEIHGIPCFTSLDDLPNAPDAAFVGVNREVSVEIVRGLREMDAGGATCFASGFSESEKESKGGADLQTRLVKAASEMPILGPNCYGFLNYFDTVTLWPDQHGGLPVKKGVAIIAQSSNIAINMTMQARALPIGYMIAAGNQAQTGIADIAKAMLDDPRVSAIGLYLEGFGDIRALERFAQKARERKVPVVALKIGRSEKAQAATITHTASLAGHTATSSALLQRLGFIEVNSIGVFLETLKIMDAFGPLPGNTICSVSCSGGEASLMADMAENTSIHFRDFSPEQGAALKRELGPIVTIANPLDYHTFIWGDTERMTRVFSEVMRDEFDLTVFVLDLPRADRCDVSDFHCAVEAIVAAKQETGARVAVLASLPENLSEAFSEQFIAGGVLPLHGMEEGLAAIDAAIGDGKPARQRPPVLLASSASKKTEVIDEADAKAALAHFGVKVPNSAIAQTPDAIAQASSGLKFPVALKGLGIAHKSEAGALALNLGSSKEVEAAARAMGDSADGFLVEEMVEGTIAELLVGITRDPTGLFLLTIGSGGIMTELIEDSANLLLPTDKDEIATALAELKVARLLNGFRGRPAANMECVTDAIMQVCKYASAHADKLIELDVNPMIITQNDAIAVDALIHLRKE